jgi:hypothetical protein
MQTSGRVTRPRQQALGKTAKSAAPFSGRSSRTSTAAEATQVKRRLGSDQRLCLAMLNHTSGAPAANRSGLNPPYGRFWAPRLQVLPAPAAGPSPSRALTVGRIMPREWGPHQTRGTS